MFRLDRIAVFFIYAFWALLIAEFDHVFLISVDAPDPGAYTIISDFDQV